MINTPEELIRFTICIPWKTADELRKPDYWSGIMSHIDGAQDMLIAFDTAHPAIQDLQFLWMVALKRRAMAYEAEA